MEFSSVRDTNQTPELLMPIDISSDLVRSREDTEPDEGPGATDTVRKRGRLRRFLEKFRVPPWKLHDVLRESQNEGSVEIPIRTIYNMASSPLKNSLHPLFWRTHWSEEVRSDESIWDVLNPVLKLASRFISEDAFMPFFYNFIFERKLLQGSPRGYERLQSFGVECPLNPEQLNLTKNYLKGLGSENNRISFEFFTEERSRRKRFGYNFTEIWDENTDRTTTTTSKICLNKGFVDTLRAHYSGLRLLTPCRLLAARLKLAMTIIHEMCHSIYRLTDASKYEPYFMGQQTSELGRAWECWMFGGRVHPNGYYFDSRAGLVCEDWPAICHGVVPKGWNEEVAASQHLGKIHSLPANPLGLGAAPWRGPLVDSMVIWRVEMEYILKIQTEEFWREEVALHGVEALRIPKVYGKRTYRIPTANQVGGEIVRVVA